MKIAIVQKIEMTQLFGKKGQQIPVTKVSVIPTKVSQIKTKDIDGYQAVRLDEEPSKAFCREFRIITKDPADLELKKGQKLGIDQIKEAKKVIAVGFSKGRGFQGAIKRHGFSRGPMSHGSHHKRKTGAIGQCEMPAKVFKGKKMPGRMGFRKVTVKNIEIIKSDSDYLYLKGSLPGPNKSYLTLREA